MESKRLEISSLHQSLGRVSEQLQASSRQADDLALAVFIVLIVRLDVTIRDALDHRDNRARFADEVEQPGVVRLKELQECPNRNVLERRVSAVQESGKVAVNATVGLIPVLQKDGVITH